MAKLENKNTNNENPKADQPISKKKSPLLLRIISYIFFTILGLIILILVAINLPVTKRYIANQAIDMLNNDFKMGMRIEDIDVNFLRKCLIMLIL